MSLSEKFKFCLTKINMNDIVPSDQSVSYVAWSYFKLRESHFDAPLTDSSGKQHHAKGRCFSRVGDARKNVYGR